MPRQPPATFRLSCSLCTWSVPVLTINYLSIPCNGSHQPPSVCPAHYMHLKLPELHLHVHSTTSRQQSATLRLTYTHYMHLELPACTNFIYPAIPRHGSHQPPFGCPTHYAPGATWLSKIHLPGHPMLRQPPATLRLSCSQYEPRATWLCKLPLPGHPTPRQPSATLRLSCSQYEPRATWLCKLPLPGHPTPRQPSANLRPSCPQCTWLYQLHYTWQSDAPVATSHPLPILLTIHLELPACTNFIYLAIPCPSSHQPLSACPAHYAPGATWLYKLHLSGPWSYLVVQTSSTWTLELPACSNFIYLDPGATCLFKLHLPGPWSYLLAQTSSTWPSHAPAAISHPPSVLATMHLEAACLNNQLPGHPMSLQPPAGCLK
jgi:hypothetical protein